MLLDLMIEHPAAVGLCALVRLFLQDVMLSIFSQGEYM
ncbi:hypothetical protein APHWI1_0530 [Anaplasma phagocytophilum str. ApWI1]|uniref:Uncharacterized protein n=3 Tax=Anaplasma phagocytophilum TaxID=948 RepID=Q2GJ83_ANAPZ|nr:hypothetical protein APH_1007 [Anaplasma phagocytophilum str. HZ]AGR79600.1 hypothetical protein YYU_04620 [Anaplasma phagocytophilum str. HZ2]AGR80855.1 hypothetical protein WSQ_04650 [Anaplasma phagocytophilum str. JM]AGR82108.1 hypothetical protein YYY_04645 [Anaplasma phagocytophilum str. Dog2]KJV59540.1 hypothetical protein APHWEB_0982 [Anaplasma phagocytophilum str. Webster]KJV62954.1 hypothetical protein EPHNCH_1347 [Anaplasma phagocytophilum str. NCH-1]KJV82443.1 hypothetical prote